MSKNCLYRSTSYINLYTGQLHTLTFDKNGLKLVILYCMDPGDIKII